MSTLNSLFASSQKTLSVSGNWFVARWTPDIATGEMLNIGVCFVGNDGISGYKLLENFERIACLYSSENAVFHARLACEVAESFFSNNALSEDVSFPNLHIEKRGFAQGETADSIADRLFESVVPLAVPKETIKPKRRFTALNSATANARIKTYLKDALSSDFEKYVPTDPYLKIKDKFGSTDVYIPFIRPGKQGKKNDGAVVASAVYVDQWRAKASLYDGMRDIETALNANEINSGLLAVVLPDRDLEKENRDKIMDEFSTFEKYAKRSGIYITSGKGTEVVAKDVYRWLRAS